MLYVSTCVASVVVEVSASDALNELLDPFRERRAYYVEHKEQVRELIHNGSAKANAIGNETVKQVKQAMSIYLD